MNERVWSNLIKKSPKQSAWQLVGRGEASAPKKNGREVRRLTYKEITEMGSQDTAWHMTHNAQNWQAAFDEEENRHASKKKVAETRTRLQWEDHGTHEEYEASLIEVAKFTRAYPQFIGAHMENRHALINWIKDRNMPVTFANLVEAFETLAIAGAITLNPSAIGAGSESEITGAALTNHRNFHLLLQRQQRPSVEETMSADEYLKSHSELHDTRKPLVVQASEARHQATAEHFAKTQAASAEAGTHTVTDYPREDRTPAQPDKVSFKKKIASMSADQIRAECQINPAFREALDNLK